MNIFTEWKVLTETQDTLGLYSYKTVLENTLIFWFVMLVYHNSTVLILQKFYICTFFSRVKLFTSVQYLWTKKSYYIEKM